MDQAEQRDLPAFELEFCVEALIQLAKSTVKFRTPRFPEVHLVNQLRLRTALSKLRLKHGTRDGEPYQQSFRQLCPDSVADQPRLFSDPGEQLLGGGRLISEDS